MHPATEKALNPFGTNGRPKLKGVDNRSKAKVPLYDNGGDVVPNAYSKLKTDANARIQSMLDEPDQLAKVKTSDDDMPEQSVHGTPRKDPSVVTRVPQATLDAIPKPAYMPGGGPANPAPAMPQIAMPANLPVFDDGGNVTEPEVRGADVVAHSTIPNLPKARPSGVRLEAGPRDYLDRPSTVENLSKMYQDVLPSFIPMLDVKPKPERLVAIGPAGQFDKPIVGEATKNSKGGMSVTGDVPSNAMAIIHSHPYGTKPIPSPQDEDTASSAGIPNFVMSRDELYVAPPHGKSIKVADISEGKDKKLNIKWDKNNPVITDETFIPPVYDAGGDVKTSTRDKSMPKSKVATIELPDAPEPQPVEEAHVRGFAPASVVRGVNDKFWTPERSAEAGVLAGETAADAYTTHKMLEHEGVHEANPLAAPLVKHGLPGQVGAAVLGNLVPLGAEYIANKTGHPKLSKAISRVAPIVEGANVARQFKELPTWESYPTYDGGGMVDNAKSAAKAMWNRVSPDASAMKSEQDSAAEGIKENYHQAQAVHDYLNNATPVIEVPAPIGKTSESDLLHPNAKYGSRKGEKRLNSVGDEVPLYDDGGPVDVNDGEHQIAVLQNGERVLTPRQAATPEAKAIPIAKGEAPVEGAKPAPVESSPVRGVTEEEKPEVTGGMHLADRWLQKNGIGAPAGLNAGTQGPARGLEQGAVAPKTLQRPVGYVPMVAPEATPSAGGVPTVRGAVAAPVSYKDKMTQLKQQHQDALEQFAKSGDPQDELRADATSRALMEYQKSNPWGSAGNHPGILGKAAHYLSMAGNIAGDVFAPETMALLIPGTQLNRAMRAKGVQNRINLELPEVEKQRALEDKSVPKPKLLTGVENTATDANGVRYQRYEMPNGSTQWFKEGEEPSTTASSTGSTQQISMPTAGGLPTGATIGKDKVDTAEEIKQRLIQSDINFRDNPSSVTGNDLKLLAEHQREVASAKIPEEIRAKIKDTPVPADYKEGYTDPQYLTDLTEWTKAYDKAIDSTPQAINAAAQKRIANNQRDEALRLAAEKHGEELVQVFNPQTDGYELMTRSDAPKDAKVYKDTPQFEKQVGKSQRLEDVQNKISDYEDTFTDTAFNKNLTQDDRRNIDRFLDNAYKGGYLPTPGAHVGSVGMSISAQQAGLEEMGKDVWQSNMSAEAKKRLNSYIVARTTALEMQRIETDSGRMSQGGMELDLGALPRPTDPPEVALQKFKTMNRSIDTFARVGVAPNMKTPADIRAERSGATVKMQAPNGDIQSVPADQVAYYKQRGAKEYKPKEGR